MESDVSTTAERRVALRLQRRWPIVSSLGTLGLALLLGWMIASRSGRTPIDAEWMAEIVEHRSPLWNGPALVMNFVGGGWFGVIAVPVAVVIALLFSRHRWGALYFVLGAVASASVVQVLKHAFARARPTEILVPSDFGSFPSGHVANAATVGVVLAVIRHRWWVGVAAAAYVILMAVSRTYLGAHWLTDTIGGALVGVGVAAVLWAPFAYRLLAELRGDGARDGADDEPVRSGAVGS